MRFLVPVVFYPMLWLRPLLMFVAKVLGWLSVLGSVGSGCFNLSSRDVPLEVWGAVFTMAGLAFGLFLLREFYDRILFRLNPTGQTLILFK
jgi:hypothetical protein